MLRLWKNRSKMRIDAASMSSSNTTNTTSTTTTTTTTTTRTTFTNSRQPHRTKQLAQLLIGSILCMTIASHPQTKAAATATAAVTAGFEERVVEASSSAALALPAAQVSSLLPEVGALSATGVLVEPYLDGFATSNVTTQIGTHAYLPCRVKQLGNKSVSWIRLRDGHILTVDRAVFIADQRFLALKQPDKYWTLQIKYVQARDAGTYECQVSTEPKVSARVQLQVVVPRTEILGEPDRYVKAGSNVVLRCIVRGALEPPTFIMWYHGTEQLAADSRRHRTQLDPNLPEASGEGQSTIGSLIIESAKKRDTGNYTCSPSNSPSATVTLNIINGESSASAVTSSAPITRAYTLCILALLLSVFLIGVGQPT
ncbi:hemicentin-2 [Drosophila mojavensis]|uniref:Uncharacterized protein, isoform A n=1 Tax=Drosophila mojavensis TaxID=7230 RepID=B4KDG0_DROMO|nr:hemicentin-2 [Drosophila mojavensis]EDW15969.2 uncharacterized protein Dmoj_GI10269, isoform A [Drosophila mojavensis]KRG01841.1 uncharacterized protein Dmoj_GI10269, isoform B [Drosophila mojavensis]